MSNVSASGKRRKNPWNLLLLPIVAGVEFLLFQAVYRTVRWLQELQCPADTYLASPTNGGDILVVLPLAVSAVGPAFLIANAIGWALPFVRRLIDDRAGGYGGPTFGEAQRGLWKFSMWIFLLLLPFALIASLSHYCVAPDRIVLREYPWSSNRSYKWDDVTAVRTECFHRGRTNRDSYEVVMSGEDAIDLAVSLTNFFRALPMIDRSLRGRWFTFSADTAACPPHLKAAFDRRPGL